MKTQNLIIGTVVLISGLTSCNGGQTLSTSQLSGEWKGSETTMTIDGNNDMAGGRRVDVDDEEISFTPVLKFGVNGDTKGGRIDIATNFSISHTITPIGKKIPVTASIGGTSTASGIWIIEDGDDIKLIIDASKTKVDIDTASLTLSYPHITKEQQDSISALRQLIASESTGIAETMMYKKINGIDKFEDVTVTDNIMTLRMMNNLITFSKQ